jgi:hypothetical protein
VLETQLEDVLMPWSAMNVVIRSASSRDMTGVFPTIS